MKIKIRQGLFETNSSSEHSIAIVNTDLYNAWKNGDVYARRLEEKEDDENSWGNFWSELRHWEFERMTSEEKDEKNRILFSEYIKNGIIANDMNKIHLKEYEAMPVGEDEYFETEECKRSFIKAQEIWIEEHEEYIKKIKLEDFDNDNKLYNHMWITYDEYMDALRNGDCYSPFEHTQGDVSVFGIYFHS